MKDEIMQEIKYKAVRASKAIKEDVENRIKMLTENIQSNIVKKSFEEKYGIEDYEMYNGGYTEQQLDEMEGFIENIKNEAGKELKDKVGQEIIGNLIEEYRDCVDEYFKGQKKEGF